LREGPAAGVYSICLDSDERPVHVRGARGVLRRAVRR
jgi:hypothetical protein